MSLRPNKHCYFDTIGYFEETVLIFCLKTPFLPHFMPKMSKNRCILLEFYRNFRFVSKLSTFKKLDFLLLKVTLPPYYETLLKDKFQQCNAIYKNKAPKVILFVKTLLCIKICASIRDINEVCYLFLDSSLILFFAVNKPISDDLHYTAYEKRS